MQLLVERTPKANMQPRLKIALVLEYTGFCVHTDRRAGLVAAQVAPASLLLGSQTGISSCDESRHSPAIKSLPSVTEADLQQALILTVRHIYSPSLLLHTRHH